LVSGIERWQRRMGKGVKVGRRESVNFKKLFFLPDQVDLFSEINTDDRNKKIIPD
jgi:hypothetical protein